MKTIAKITLDLQRPNFATEVDAMQDDGETRILEVSLTSGGTPWNVPEGAAPMVVFRRPNYTKGMYDQLADGSPAISVDGNTVTVVLSRQMLAVPGQVRASLQFEDAQLNMLTTFPFKINVQANPYGGAQSVQDVVRLQWLEDELGKWLKKAAESGEFDGPVGPAGKTPEKGVDYFTAEEKQQFEDAVYDRASEKINPAIEKAENAAKAATDAAAEIPGQIAGKLDKPAAQPAVGQILKVQKINPDGTFVVGWADDGGGTVQDVQIQIAGKLDKPAAQPAVGQILKVQKINPDGTFVVGWADDGGGTVQDVQINGDTILQDGVANVQLSNGLTHGTALGIATPTQEQIAGRNPAVAITGATLDSGVKVAMCDGVGPAWTADEQATARDRMGDEYVLIGEITTEEAVSRVTFNAAMDGKPFAFRDVAITIFIPTAIPAYNCAYHLGGSYIGEISLGYKDSYQCTYLHMYKLNNKLVVDDTNYSYAGKNGLLYYYPIKPITAPIILSAVSKEHKLPISTEIRLFGKR